MLVGAKELYMLFASWKVHIVKNCDRGLENAAQGCRPRAALSSLKRKNTHRKKTRASVTVTVVRDRKIWTALRTNQIVGFVTMPAWKKIRYSYYTIRTCWVHDWRLPLKQKAHQPFAQSQSYLWSTSLESSP